MFYRGTPLNKLLRELFDKKMNFVLPKPFLVFLFSGNSTSFSQIVPLHGKKQ
jgi:hypothetical protein